MDILPWSYFLERSGGILQILSLCSGIMAPFKPLLIPLRLLLIFFSFRFLLLHGYFGVFLGGIIGVLISGSVCCGSSLLIPLGASVFANTLAKYFPYGGLELKILGIIILLFGLYQLLKNLTTCQAKKPH